VDIALWHRYRKLTRVNPWFSTFRVIIKNPLFIVSNNFLQKIFFPEFWKQCECSITLSISVVFGQFIWKPSFWTFPIICKRTKMACCVTKLFCKLLFSVRRVYIQQCLIRRLNLLRVSSMRFIFKTEISLAKFLILSFTCSMTYSVLSICITNHCSSFSSIFLQMKREMNGKSNVPSWTLLVFEVMCIKCQTVWHFRRPNVNALISAGRYIRFKLLFR